MSQEKDSKGSGKDAASSPKSSIPSINLPKGGGAIRGIGEKFAANPVTGTGSMSVPIATSPGRSGFGPQLSLSYDSGSGNGPFGIGWSLSLPSITRKTDKGLPQYQDAEESDVFILSGAEDLVPVLSSDGSRSKDDKTLPAYSISRYRPRIEGLFARIERWTDNQTGEIHWRSISKDNITTLYGKDSNSRIFDPADPDPDHPTRIFSWLICESYDDKGNVVLYRYREEDSAGIDGSVHERNRSEESRSVNHYLKRIKYGNTVSRLIQPDLSQMDWLFEVVFDYGDHDTASPGLGETDNWPCRLDPFSSYRAGFEVRTYRLCRRVLMFHHFENELGTPDYLVRSTDFSYHKSPIGSFITSVTQSGYIRGDEGSYRRKSLPPINFEYSRAVIQEEVKELDAESLENLPYGLDGAHYQWVDLDGEGVSGILTEQADAWFYKPNLGGGRFGPLEKVTVKPSLAALGSGRQQLMDLAGDGQLDLVELSGAVPGFYERTQDQGWEPFRTFASLPNIPWNDPNLKFVDLTGDGHADILVTEDEVFTWYPSLAEEGFGPAEWVRQPRNEESGPRLLFADGTQSVYLADLSGDGLSDLARIRNSEVCYWPNLGYGRFGAKVTMDNAPWFDHPDLFDQKRIRLADIDGSGTTDIIYLEKDRVAIYRNECGNSWSDAEYLANFPRVDNLSSVLAADLFGNGTACLVWSSPLPGNTQRPMRYVDLMGGQKPHLLVKTVNNLGAETRVQYVPSTKFYLQDKRDGKPWITRLPFPVHVVERVETYDHISHNRVVTRYAYHHGYFDGDEREFRGFGMVEQWDTEQLAALSNSDAFPAGDNIAAESHVPPVHTKTWFHTGIYFGRDHVSDFFAGLLNATDQGEYFREPGLTDAQARALLLPDTVLPAGLMLVEEREACRALKGAMLRQEVYALDGSDKEPYPYTVTEQNFTIERLQSKGSNRHAVFFTHPREAISYHYERNPVDPRVQHALTLEVDKFGNVLKSVAIGYGRRQGQSPLHGDDKTKQEQTLITYTENQVTNPIEDTAFYPDDYRTPLPCEVRTYEVTGFALAADMARFSFESFTDNNFQALLALVEIKYEESTDYAKKQKRLIECVRSLYRKDNLTGLLGKGVLEPMALPGESCKLAFTPGLLDQVYVRSGQKLLPTNPADVLEGGGADRGGYVDLDGDDHWWIPSGRSFFSIDPDDSAAAELAEARQHFFLPRRYCDPFGQDATVSFDDYDLLMVETRDALGNLVTVEANDYRVLQPHLVSDPNRNQTAVVFDMLGMEAGTAVMGKPAPLTVEGDSLESFVADLTQSQIDDFLDAADPHTVAPDLLKSATTRIVYDLESFLRTQSDNPGEPDKWLPPYAATLARETHTSDPLPQQGLKIQISFSYSDGFGREIQKKIQAEPEKNNGVIGPPRWVGSGWTIFNNKGKPVRQYEPFFSQLPPAERHHFEFGVMVGVSPVLFYDPVERVIATLHPNHTYEKVVFDPWQQTTYDVNDTVALRNAQIGDPRTDLDIKGYVEEYFKTLPVDPAQPWKTWYQQRSNDNTRPHEQAAAQKASAHADTPTTAHFDALGRPFLTLVRNRVVCANHALDGIENEIATRVELDIEGNQRSVKDERKKQDGTLEQRIVMRYAYDMLGNRIHQFSMEAGERWMLNDVTGKPVRAWDSRGHDFVTAYDELRRPVEQYVRGSTDDSDPRTRKVDPLLVDKIEYGESQKDIDVEALNLRTRIYRHSDSAGVVTNAALNPSSNQTEAYDFKGNLLRSTRQLIIDYKKIPDWRQNPKLDDETFTSSSRYDALNRPVQSIAPHSNFARAKRNIAQPVFNEANLLERVDVWLDRSAEPPELLDPEKLASSSVGIANIDYDAKGQRQRIDYKNGASTFYDYDPLTFRLVHLLTRREAFPEDCPNPAPEGWPGCQVQNLSYTYDPAGNITHIQDDAQQTIYFKNQRVEPSNDYTYDAIYRLVEARGREHLGQGGAPILHSYNDAGRVGVLSADAAGRFSPNDRNAMGTYVERYVYDAVGNFLEMKHKSTDAQIPSWSRSYTYNEASLIEAAKQSNRLSTTTIGGAPETYSTLGDGYDAHGNILRMPQLQLMQWDYRDQLRTTQRQKINDEDYEGEIHKGDRSWYVYDAGGQRVRKVTELASGNVIEERIYLGGFEIFRRHGGAIGANTATLEREMLHVMDDKQRIALVETRTLDTTATDLAPDQLIRYQFGNHLGSASLELDDQAQIISYEEYTPYGSTSYQAVRSLTETPKRYRYTGKERDEESGLYYHGARYCAPWLGRWISCDPAGLVDGPNLFLYVQANPLRLVDAGGMQSGTQQLDPLPAERYEEYLNRYKKELGVSCPLTQGQFQSLSSQTNPLPRIEPNPPPSIGLPTPGSVPERVFQARREAAKSCLGSLTSNCISAGLVFNAYAVGLPVEQQAAAGRMGEIGNVASFGLARGAESAKALDALAEQRLVLHSDLISASSSSGRAEQKAPRGLIEVARGQTVEDARANMLAARLHWFLRKGVLTIGVASTETSQGKPGPYVVSVSGKGALPDKIIEGLMPGAEIGVPKGFQGYGTDRFSWHAEPRAAKFAVDVLRLKVIGVGASRGICPACASELPAQDIELRSPMYTGPKYNLPILGPILQLRF